MKRPELHQVEVAILRTLRRRSSARFNEIMKQTDLLSDSFKFYIRRLAELNYIHKNNEGLYALTAKGKEFANNLDEQTLMIQKQPKLSMLMLIARPGQPSQLLFQYRLRQPYYGFYGVISGPVPWGLDVEAAAAQELLKQTGLHGDARVFGFYRQKDLDSHTGALLEDKLFAVLQVNVRSDLLTNDWAGGRNVWMTVDEYKLQSKRFDSTNTALEMVVSGRTYISKDIDVDKQDY